MNLEVRALSWFVAFSGWLATARAAPLQVSPTPAEYPVSRCAGLFADAARRCEELAHPEPLDAHARKHDGFFVRAGVGPSVFRSRVPGVDERTLDVGGEVLFGGTPLCGFVIGGGALGEGLGTRHPLVAYAAFAQLYPDPKRGLHFQLLGALAILEDRPSILGPLAAGGVGMDVFVGRQVSLGGFARAGYARGFGEGGVRVDAPFASLSATLTWH